MRHLVSALIGALVVFVCGFTAWVAIDAYKFAFPKTTVAGEVAIAEALKTHLTEDGSYFLPMMPEGFGNEPADEAKKAEFADFEARTKAGPIALVFFHKDGRAPMEVSELVNGFLIEFVSALMLACVLSGVTGGMCRKVWVGFTIALFAATACYGVVGNFMHFPQSFVLAVWADAVISWTLCSIVISAIQTRCGKDGGKCCASAAAAA